MRVIAYTDGSCITGRRGGWGFVLLEERISEVYGGEKDTTNNRMELTAVLMLLRFTTRDLLIRTDSQLIINCAQKLWKRNMNLDLWTMYDEMSNGRDIKYEWVKAHNGDTYNENADKLAKTGANSI